MRSWCCLLMAIYFHIHTFAQTGTDIILFDLKVNAAGISLSNPVNITSHAGYDNQPFFYKTDIYYSSADSGQMDIKKYNYQTKITSTITHTADNEFSPTFTPDGKFISCILQRKNGKQDLVKYPINGGEPVMIIDNLKVGYHVWIDNNSLLLFVLEDTVTNGLHYYNTKTKDATRITTRIGRSLHKIPGKNAISFIQKDSTAWFIKKYDVLSKKVSTIMATLPGHEDITWTNSGIIITSDGKEIYYSKPGNNGWQKITMMTDELFKNVTRLALNKQNTKLAVVVAE